MSFRASRRAMGARLRLSFGQVVYPACALLRASNLSMETAMDRAQKQEAIESLKGVFDGAGAVVVTHYMGLTVAEMTDLRGRLREQGAQLQVVKNTLVQKALNGSVGEAGDALFKGPVAIAFASGRDLRRQGRDPVRQGQRQVHRRRRPHGSTGPGQGVGDRSREPCRRSTSSAPSSSASSRRPRPRSPACCRLRRAQIARVIGAYAAKDAA